MMSELYLVTGALGHLGNVVIRQLLEQGKQVRGLVLPSDGPVRYSHRRLQLVYGDVCDRMSLAAFFENAAGHDLTVIHTAGVVSIASEAGTTVRDVNVEGTRNILELSLRHHVKRVVQVSSVHAITEPPDGRQIVEPAAFDPDTVVGLYAQTKAEASQLALEFAAAGLDVSLVHPSGILGPFDYGHGHLTQMVEDYCRGRLVACVRGGYDFVDVRDVAASTIACAERGQAGGCYILSGHYCTVYDLLWMLHEITGRRPVRTILPMWLAQSTAPLAELYYRALHRPPLYTSYSLYTLESNANFSNQKARKVLGHRPRALDQTLYDTIAWLRRLGRIPGPRVAVPISVD